MGKQAGNGTKPASTGNWVNVTASPMTTDQILSLSRVRVLFGTTNTSGATTSQTSTAHHGYFNTMMGEVKAQEAIDNARRSRTSDHAPRLLTCSLRSRLGLECVYAYRKTDFCNRTRNWRNAVVEVALDQRDVQVIKAIESCISLLSLSNAPTNPRDGPCSPIWAAG